MGIAEGLWLAVDESEEDVATNATEEAMASTATSVRNSSFEGKMLCGGSFIDFSNEFDGTEEDEEGRR